MHDYDSQEERYFSWYLAELLLEKIITKWYYHPKPFTLSDRIVRVYEKQLKTKKVILDSVILNDHKYQADFLIYWNPDWRRKVFMNLECPVCHKNTPFIAQGKNDYSVVDVKGTFVGKHNNSAVTFPLDQKWVYQKYAIYVQKIIPVSLFKETFTPQRYMLTDAASRPRKLGYDPVFIKQYLSQFNE